MRGRPASPARSGSANCSKSRRRPPSGSATSRSRSSRRASSRARISSPARSSTRRALRRLFKGRPEQLEQLPSYGDVHGEAVYVLTKGTTNRVPPPPTMRNHGNLIVSVAQLGRFLGEQAEAAGAAILPETDAQKLLVADGRVHGIRTGDKGRGREGQELGELRARLGHRRPRDRSRGGNAGPSHRRRDCALRPRGERPPAVGARSQGGVEGRAATRSHRPHDGLAAPQARPLRRVRRLVHLPDGRRPRLDRLRRRAGVPRRRVLGARRAPGVQDPPARAEDPPRRRAGRLGREDDHRGRLPCAPEALQRAGPAPRRRGRRPRQRADVEGDPLRDRVGDHGRRGSLPLPPARREPVPRGRARLLRRGAAGELRARRSPRGAEHAAGLRQGLLLRRRLRERDDDHEGEAAAEGLPLRAERGAFAAAHESRQELPGAGRQAHLRQAVVRLPLRQPHARRPAEPHPARAAGAARAGGALGAHVPGPGLRGRSGQRRRHRHRRAWRRRTASSAARSPPRAAG